MCVCGHELFRVMAVLTALGEGTEKIDMTRMKNILNQRIIKVLNLVSCCHLFCLILLSQTISTHNALVISLPLRLKKLLITSLLFRSLVISCLVELPLM